jgi:DnaJ-class molecular chaperone
MTPRNLKKLGEKVTIICPDCDGSGKELGDVMVGELKECFTCKGTGKVEGVVTNIK